MREEHEVTSKWFFTCGSLPIPLCNQNLLSFLALNGICFHPLGTSIRTVEQTSNRFKPKERMCWQRMYRTWSCQLSIWEETTSGYAWYPARILNLSTRIIIMHSLPLLSKIQLKLLAARLLSAKSKLHNTQTQPFVFVVNLVQGQGEVWMTGFGITWCYTYTILYAQFLYAWSHTLYSLVFSC